MEITRYTVCGEVGECESYTAIAMAIEEKTDLENVRIDPESGEVSFDNPTNCHVDEHLLEEAAREPGRHIRFEVCGKDGK